MSAQTSRVRPLTQGPKVNLRAPALLRPRTRDLHVLHIGKTGGSALAHALGQATLPRGGRIHCHKHKVRLHDIPPGHDIVFALRDPVARLVSGFYSRKRRGRPRYDIPWTSAEARAFARFPDIGDLAVALGEADPRRHLAAMEALDAIGHVRMRYWHWFGGPGSLRRRADDVLMILRQERLTQDFGELCSLLALNPAPTLPDDRIIRHQAWTPPPPVSAEAARILRAVCAQDHGFIRFCERELGLRPLRPADPRAPAIAPSPPPAVASAG